MGTETHLDEIVVYNKETGERIGTLGTDTTLNPVREKHGDFLLNDSLSFWIRPHRLSRKRFVKKLMAMGISRNMANQYAKICAANKRPYSQQYWTVVMFGLL